MSKVRILFPEASRPGEYIAFFSIPMNTKEGKVFVFIAIDAFSDFAFNVGLEMDETPVSILRCIKQLTENEDFLRHRDKGFTLVFENYDELSEEINSQINPVHGHLMFNKPFLQQISQAFKISFQQFLSNPQL